MNSDEQNIQKFLFETPSNIMISGCTQSGKTFFTFNIINNADKLFTNPPTKIIYCYKIFQRSFNSFQHKVTFHQGIPENIEEIADKNNNHILIVLDDLMNCIDQRIVDLFTVGTHHLNISCVFITQNIFHHSKYLRTISLNAHYIILFRQRDSNQIEVLARQILGSSKAKEFSKLYDTSMQKRFGYLVLNMHPANNFKTLIHQNIMPDELTLTYLP